MQVKDLQLQRALRTALLVLLLCAGMKSYAEHVEPEVARTVAATFLNNNGVRSNQLTDLSERAGFPNLYIFNGESGFVVMAADDRAKPILGYSLTGRFVAENMPENLRFWLQGYNDQIQYAIDNQLRGSAEAAQEWERVIQGRTNRSVVIEPLISTKWNQDYPYNYYCPAAYSGPGGRCYAGCLATAMAQIIKYHQYPEVGVGSHYYIPFTHPEYGEQSAIFGATVYPFSDMPDIINSVNYYVARLIYDCGVSVDMDYNPDLSTASVEDAVEAFQNYFDYAACEFRYMNAFQENWVDLLKQELNDGRPLLYYGNGSGGHAFVCDGYDNYNYFHFNWGWGGDCDDYYSLDALLPYPDQNPLQWTGDNFTNDQGAIFGIQPSEHGCEAPVLLTGSMSGRTVTFSWDAASDVDSYRIYRNNELIETEATGTSYTDDNLEIGLYHYYLRSNCADGSVSAPSYIAQFEIEYEGDVTATIGNLVFSLNEQTLTAEVTGHEPSYNSGSLTIPSMVTYTNQYGQTHTYTVTSIGYSAFSYCSGFTGSLTIPNSVTSIGQYAFSNCSGFTGSLTIPNSVTSIGDGAFSGCSFNGLYVDMIVISSSWMGFIHDIGGNFTGSLTIGNSVTSIGDNVFDGCSEFTGSLSIGNSVTRIGKRAFYGCSGFTGSLTIPNSVSSIGQYAFEGCSGFTGSLTIPNSVSSIGQYAFKGCSGFTGNLTIPNSVSSIGKYAFSGCSFNGLNVNMVVIPSSSFGFINDIGGDYSGPLTIGHSVTSIGWNAFRGCGGLTGNLTIPNSVTNIGSAAFEGCSGFTGSLTIPNSVTSLGQNAFSSCSFNDLEIDMTSIPEEAFYNCGSFTGSLTIGNSVESIGERAFASCSGFTGSLTIPNSVTSIGNSAFNGCSGFDGSLTIPNSVTSLGQYAFSDCGFNGLEIDMTSIPDQAFNNSYGGDYSNFTGGLTIGNSVTSIGWRAFCECSGFTGSLTIPNSVTSIGSYAFSGCNGFTGNLTIGNSVTSIGEYAFSGCSSITGNLTIPNSVTSIGNSAFSGCNGFTGHITIGNSVTSIGEYVFYGCSGFTGNLAIPNTVTSIGEYAFYGCSGFTGSLTIGNSVTSIGNQAFRGCSGFMGNLIIPNSVSSIGATAFAFCGSNGVAGILTIPNSVTSLGDYAFYGCGFSGLDINMTNVPDWAFYECNSFTGNLTIGNSVTSIGYRAFSGCSGFTGGLTIPNSVTDIESYAFYGCSGFTGGLTIPNSVTDLGWSTFEGCSGFTGSLVISNSVTSIREGTFRNCSGFTGSLTIPEAVTYIDEEAFAGCSGFTGNLIIPNSVTYIYEGAFKNCSGFTGDLTIPNSITYLNGSVFQGCSGLTGDVIIPDGVISIRANAFEGCSGLSGDLSIPHSVTSIGENAFASCSGLTSIHSYGAVPPTTSSNAFANMDFSIPVYVPLCSASDYGETDPWSNFANYQAALPCPYTFTGNGSDNLWSNPENWHTMPTNDYDIIINANCEMDEDVEASGVIINNTGTLVIKSGHVLTIRENRTRSGEALNGEIVNRGNTTNLIIEDGGQLVYGKDGLLGMVKKDIVPFTLNGNDGWHLLSSPVVGSRTVEYVDMLSNDYDLYYYDEPTHYWKNYKNPENGFDKLEATQGYLYANSGVVAPAGSHVGKTYYSESSSYYPLYTYYEYTISESLYRIAELLEAGLGTNPLGGLCWYAIDESGYEQNNISIWMANVSDEELTETSHITTEMTLVFSGSITPSKGWNEIVFNENTFAWDGMSNILVCVQRNNGSYNRRIYWRCHSVDFVAQTYAYDMYDAYDVETTNYTMNIATNRPDIIFQKVDEIGTIGQTPITLHFYGELENGSAAIDVPLSYTEGIPLAGFNLVGNPFVHNVTSYASTNVAEGCFRLNDLRDNLVVSEISEAKPLKPTEGFFVKATGENASITFNAQTRGETEKGCSVSLELITDGKLIDRFIVKNEGDPLEKLSLKENSTRIYATQDRQDYAVVVRGRDAAHHVSTEMPINFKTAKNGTYTLMANVENIDLEYLHLIDNLTGADVDLLQTPSYTFTGKTTDYATRFRLVFATGSSVEDDNFGFINGSGNLCIFGIEGTSTLQVIDVTGRVLSSETFSGSYEKRLNTTPGVYVIRLINGNEVRTQKIVLQ